MVYMYVNHIGKDNYTDKWVCQPLFAYLAAREEIIVFLEALTTKQTMRQPGCMFTF